MSKGIVFIGVILIIVFGIMEVAAISMLDKNNVIVLVSGIMGLFGGVIGATTAYCVAKKQIEKQDSMKKMDLKLEKFVPVIKEMKLVKDEMINIFNMFEYYYRGGCSEEELITFLEGSKYKSNGYWRKIENEHLYLEMIFKDENELKSIKISTISFYMDDIKDLKSMMADDYRPFYQIIKFKEINEAIEKLEKEVKNILLK